MEAENVWLSIFMDVIVAPLLFIWALNQLFATGIEYSLVNWAAVSVMVSFIVHRFRI